MDKKASEGKNFGATETAFEVAKKEPIGKFNIVFYIPQTRQFINMDHGRGKGLAEASPVVETLPAAAEWLSGLRVSLRARERRESCGRAAALRGLQLDRSCQPSTPWRVEGSEGLASLATCHFDQRFRILSMP